VTPREYAERVVNDIRFDLETTEHALEVVAGAIAEAVAEERESCALVCEQVAGTAPAAGAGAAVKSARLIRQRAGASISARREQAGG
jgi:hypothetical protein